MDNASILFINTSLLLEHRKDWRFLYSTQTHPRNLEVSNRTVIRAVNVSRNFTDP